MPSLVQFSCRYLGLLVVICYFCFGVAALWALHEAVCLRLDWCLILIDFGRLFVWFL